MTPPNYRSAPQCNNCISYSAPCGGPVCTQWEHPITPNNLCDSHPRITAAERVQALEAEHAAAIKLIAARKSWELRRGYHTNSRHAHWQYLDALKVWEGACNRAALAALDAATAKETLTVEEVKGE